MIEAQQDQESPAVAPAPEIAEDPAAFVSSRVVRSVFDRILDAVHEGRMLPGERISDSLLAAQLGVSRTPVREALQRLREMGIVEASASRFTRVAVVTPQQTADAMVVWAALYGALVTEVLPRVSALTVELMRADHLVFLSHISELDAQKIAMANADFFSHLIAVSTNPVLQRAVTSTTHLIRLGSLHLPEFIDLAALAATQAELIEASGRRDVAAARVALRELGNLVIPLEPRE